MTATKTEKALKDVPATVSVVTADDMLIKGTRYMGDELQSLPGVYVEKNDDGTYTSVTIRGVRSQHHNDTFLAMVDGVPMVTGSDEIDMEVIPVDAVERVEVVKGPMSALYGRGSISGAVNYISKTVPLQTTGLVGVNVGNYGYVRPTAAMGFTLSPGKNHLYASGSGEWKDGWRDETARKGGNFFLKDQWFLNDKTDLIFYVNYMNNRQDISSHIPMRANGSLVSVTGGDKANYNIDDSFYDKNGTMASAVLRQVPRNNLNINTTLHYRRYESEANLGFNDGVDEAQGVIKWNGFNGLGDQSVFFVEPQLTWGTGKARLVAGASYEHVSGSSQEFWTGEAGFSFTDFEFYFYTQRRSYQDGRFINSSSWVTDKLLDADYAAHVGAGYGQLEFDLGSRATLSAGLRIDHFDRDVEYGALNTSLDGPTAGSTKSDSDSHVSPKLALTVQMTPQVTAYAAYGEGFSPAFGPVWAFGSRDVNLKPEVARNVEGGIKGDLAGGHVGFSAAAYRLERRDLLQLVFDGPGTKTVNAGKQEVKGLEVDTRFSTRGGDRDFTGYVRYAYTDSVWTNNTFVNDFTGETITLSGREVTRVPKHQFSVGGTQRLPGNLAANVWYDFAGKYWIDGDNENEADAVGLLNASLSMRASRLVELQVTATNLTDKRYYYYYGTSSVPSEAYPAMPFQLLASVRLHLGQ